MRSGTPVMGSDLEVQAEKEVKKILNPESWRLETKVFETESKQLAFAVLEKLVSMMGGAEISHLARINIDSSDVDDPQAISDGLKWRVWSAG